ncbi:MAG TPA: hypothetical protein VGK73_06715 [Polyangiaceae bacterium]
MTGKRGAVGKAAPSRSGSRISYSERKEAGWTLVRAEFDARTLMRLDELRAAEGGLSRAEMLRTVVDAAWAELKP